MQIQSQIDVRSADYQQNYDHNAGLVRQLQERLAAARAGGSERAVRKHVEAGKLLPPNKNKKETIAL